ncbi:MAG: hypothetical protein L0287_00215 [Anaerolineae bacterium]|nr:hypothetical protein [Anaerolineae bacterium]
MKWAPHPKSMSLGQLALHVASLPGSISNLLMMDGFDALKAQFDPPHPESKEQILSVLEAGLVGAKQVLGDWDHQKATSPWRLTKGEEEVFTIPRSGVARSILLNHWYHHRGQLTVYLRLLDVPLPVTYGRSADEDPFA